MDDLAQNIITFVKDTFGKDVTEATVNALITQAEMLYSQYNMRNEQKVAVYTAYVLCQFSSPPFSIIPPGQFVTSEHVRDFSIGYSVPAFDKQIGYCGYLDELLKVIGYTNKVLSPIIVTRFKK